MVSSITRALARALVLVGACVPAHDAITKASGEKECFMSRMRGERRDVVWVHEALQCGGGRYVGQQRGAVVRARQQPGCIARAIVQPSYVAYSSLVAAELCYAR